MKNTHTVLLVDNDAFLRRVYGTRLMSAGYNVLLAGDVVEGSRLAGEHIPHAILCDAQADHGRGLELVRALASSTKTAHIPVLCLSNTWDENDKKAALAAGANAYAMKAHITPTELAAHVERMLA